MTQRELLATILPGAALLVFAAGCGESALAAEPSGPAAVGCKLFWRASNTVGPSDSPTDPKFQFQERAIRVGRGEQASASLADIALDVHYLSDAFEGSSVSVRAAFDGKALVSWLFQLSTSSPPKNQFVGGHGFTGLVYLTHPTKEGDYQFMCEFADS
jgi:hypothetical protein